MRERYYNNGKRTEGRGRRIIEACHQYRHTLPLRSDALLSVYTISKKKKRKEDEQDICGEKEKEKEREKHIITKKTQY